jgi:2,4-dienoyl-CoA reductase (NADPH2)
VAAERGHRVTLFEQQRDLGGAVRIAAASPHRATLIDIVDHLDRELRRLKVDVNLGAAISADDLAEIRGLADHVVLATGSTVAPPPVEAPGAVSVEDVLLGRVPDEPGHAVVYDEADGFWPAYSAAEALAQRGWQVTFATAMTALAPRVPHESVGPLLTRLGDAGVSMQVAHRLVVEGGTALLQPVFGGPSVTLGPGLVVWHQQRVAVDALRRTASDGATLTAIGDCVTPRRISHAIAEGYRTGAEI